MISEKLQQARDFEAAYGPHITTPEREAFHVTGPIGWINDPNGFSCYKGEYHLFFQYNPYAHHWGPMHWGHVKTKDFIRWERLPAVLAPDCELDKDGCFSGSAIELADGRHLLMYTGVHATRRADGVVETLQSQCLAFGDGVNYEKHPEPVIDGADLPEGGSVVDFRDPKLWQEEDGTFWAVIGNRCEDGSGTILLYRSEDLFHWSFVTVLERCRNEYGRMWECPEFFPLDGKHVLLTCPMEMPEIGLEFHSGYGTLALIGAYDKDSHTFTRERVQAIDYGLDFYATQTLKAPDGRTIMIAWMQNWATSCNVPQDARLMGEMTLPRELSLRNGRLCQNPVRELEAYRGRRAAFEHVLLRQEQSLPGVAGRLLDMTVTARPGDGEGYEWFQVRLGVDGVHSADIRYLPGPNILHIDRSRSGGGYDIVHVRDVPVLPHGGEVKLRFVTDYHSVEIFVNDGEQAASLRLYSPVSAQDVLFAAQGTVLMDVECYQLEIPQA